MAVTQTAVSLQKALDLMSRTRFSFLTPAHHVDVVTRVPKVHQINLTAGERMDEDNVVDAYNEIITGMSTSSGTLATRGGSGNGSLRMEKQPSVTNLQGSRSLVSVPTTNVEGSEASTISEDGFWLDGDDTLSQYELTPKVRVSLIYTHSNGCLPVSVGYASLAHRSP